MQYLILFLAIALLGVALVLGFRPRPAAARRPESGAPMLGLYEPDPVLPPVLLPERPRGADIDGLRLSPALRGYRCDQVDGVLDALAAEIERLHAELETLAGAREPGRAEAEELRRDWGPRASAQPPAAAPAGAQGRAADSAPAPQAEAPTAASKHDEEGPFEEQSQTFRSL